jgi:hypothetical protein
MLFQASIMVLNSASMTARTSQTKGDKVETDRPPPQSRPVKLELMAEKT